MSTTRILFLSALIFAYRIRWVLAVIAAALFGALWAACVGEVR